MDFVCFANRQQNKKCQSTRRPGTGQLAVDYTYWLLQTHKRDLFQWPILESKREARILEYKSKAR